VGVVGLADAPREDLPKEREDVTLVGESAKEMTWDWGKDWVVMEDELCREPL
jgi:hypothetical protein